MNYDTFLGIHGDTKREAGDGMFRLYFKHLYPSFPEWQEAPFAPWQFDNEGVLFSIVGFFESTLLQDDFSLNQSLQCETFMDSGAFAAETMNFSLDPYEVAELHALLKADLIVPLDKIILAEDSDAVIEQKLPKQFQTRKFYLIINLKVVKSWVHCKDTHQISSKRCLKNIVS